MDLIDRGHAPIKEDQPVFGVVDGVKVIGTSYIGNPPTEINYRDQDYAYERDRAINHNTKDGILPMTPEEQAFERSVSYRLVKEFTMKVFSLDFTGFSFPVEYSEERSFLERTADLYTFLATKYIDKLETTSDPYRKIMYMTTGVVAGFHIYMQSKKPWNPILGETFVGRWPNGTVIYGEQSCHHPPVSDFQIYGPDNSWYCHAQCRFKIDSGIFQVDIPQNGVFRLEFPNGDVYEWEFPIITVVGILRGDRIVRVKGPFVMRDVKNDIECYINIAPKANKKIGLVNTRQTTIYGGVRRIGQTEYERVITGDYTDKVMFGEEVLWDINNDFACRATAPVERCEMLPSDCRFRLDRMMLIRKDLEESGKAKKIMEEAQRRDRSLRK